MSSLSKPSLLLVSLSAHCNIATSAALCFSLFLRAVPVFLSGWQTSSNCVSSGVESSGLIITESPRHNMIDLETGQRTSAYIPVKVQVRDSMLTCCSSP
jgi:hypothetical protein